MDEFVVWSVEELEQIIMDEADDGSIVCMNLTVDMSRKEGFDG